MTDETKIRESLAQGARPEFTHFISDNSAEPATLVTKPEILRCPFDCDGIVSVDTFDTTPDGKEQSTCVECLGCGIRTTRFKNREDAITFWNTRAPQASEWMDISSAPKDGTEILAYRDNAGVFLVRWDAPENFMTEDECVKLGDSAEFYSWIFADFIQGDRCEGDQTPTHWMSLPAPPRISTPTKVE